MLEMLFENTSTENLTCKIKTREKQKTKTNFLISHHPSHKTTSTNNTVQPTTKVTNKNNKYVQSQTAIFYQNNVALVPKDGNASNMIRFI